MTRRDNIKTLRGTMTKQAPTLTDVPEQKPGESNKAYSRRLSAFLAGDDVRSKMDDREWTGSPPFHLSRDGTQYR